MKLISFISLITVVAASGFVYSCASSESGFGGGSGSNTSTNGGDGSGSTGSKGGSTSIPVSTGGTETIGSEDTCGATEVAAELTPVYMVFVYDKSASMGVNNSVTPPLDNTELRWKPVKNGVIDFFTNAGTKNVQASIAFFAYPGDVAITCGHDYSVPDVPMTPLETPDALINALNAKVPEGGTPTLPAVIGGIKYAKKLLADHPGSEAMVVLVTDGVPAVIDKTTGQQVDTCAPAGIALTNTIPDITTYVSGARLGNPSINTHVIGIGEPADIASLETIAAAGTGDATNFLLINPTDATATRKAIIDKLTAIQPKTISCNIALPTKAADFDPDEVNVDFLHANGTVDKFAQSDDDCNKPGWRYDNATTPKYIQLCESTCKAIQADLDGKLKVVLGCPTRVLL